MFVRYEHDVTSLKPSIFVESEQLRDITQETFFLLGKGDTVYTDDELPIEEVLTNMHQTLESN